MTQWVGPTIWRGHAALYQWPLAVNPSDQMTAKTTRASALIFWQNHRSTKIGPCDPDSFSVQIFGPILYAAIAALYQSSSSTHIFWQNTKYTLLTESTRTTCATTSFFRQNDRPYFQSKSICPIFSDSKWTQFASKSIYPVFFETQRSKKCVMTGKKVTPKPGHENGKTEENDKMANQRKRPQGTISDKISSSDRKKNKTLNNGQVT